MGLEKLADILTGLASISDLSQDRKLMKIYSAMSDAFMVKIPPAELEAGVGYQIGDFTTLLSYDAYGMEIGYRLVKTRCIIGKNNNKLFEFVRDGIEIEQTGSERCEIASGNWYKDFCKACKTQNPVALELPFGSARGDYASPQLNSAPNRVAVMWDAMQHPTLSAEAYLKRLMTRGKGGMTP